MEQSGSDYLMEWAKNAKHISESINEIWPDDVGNKVAEELSYYSCESLAIAEQMAGSEKWLEKSIEICLDIIKKCSEE